MSRIAPDPESIFGQAIEIESPGDRADFINQACGDNPLLRDEVEHLVADHFRAGNFLQQPVARIAAIGDLPTHEEPGSHIGPYKLLEQIGEGGFGVVFMAEQTAPVRRKVALKIIKPGMDTKHVIARFEAERQALALMDHPHIARVFDGGETASGRPYFAMELVHGVPITEFCNHQKLTQRQRLKLFVDVCRTIQHAHQKGIIHRDLKPSNIMITWHDDKAVPKVIDFGVSKAISYQLTEKTLFTAYGQMVGTPLYMSPEQAQLSGLDVDTRSDVYSLGVLLYELVTGTTPFDEETLRRVGYDELRRMIREQEPPCPSARVSTLQADLLSTVSDQRKIDPHKLSHSLRGEVDWIAMKALEKDRDRRYESANSLAADVERYLNDEPVEACPPTMLYRLKKYVRRYKAVLAVAGVISSLLLLAIVSLVVGTVLAWQANNKATHALEQRRRVSYFQQVALAEREWSANNLKRANELIEACPADLRGWEWHYLKRLRASPLPPLRHKNMVWGCSVSPDGSQIVTADFTGRIYFWDAVTGNEMRPPVLGHDTAGGGFVTFSSDGDRFATSGWADVKVWDAKSGKQLHQWKAPNGTIQGLTYAPDGRLVTCVSTLAGDGDVTSIWDAHTSRMLFAVPELHHIVQTIALSPDGKHLALPCEDGTLRILDSVAGTTVRIFHGTGKFWQAAFSPDGTLIAAVTSREGEQHSGTVQIWEVGTGQERLTLTGHGGRCVVFSRDGQRLVTGGMDQALKIWDTASGEEILTLRGHSDYVRSVTFTPDGQRLISSSDDRSVRIWDGSPWHEGERFGESVLTLHGHTDSVNAVAFHPRENWLASASTDGTIKFWDTRSWDMLRDLSVGLETVDALAFSPRGERLAVIGTPGRYVILLDPASGEEIGRLGEFGDSTAISTAFSSDGQLLAAGDDEGRVTMFDVATGTVVRSLQTSSKYTGAVSLSPESEGGHLAAGSVDGSIRIWDTATGRQIDASPLTHPGTLVGIAFSPDGKALASIGWDRTVRIWETSHWSQTQVLMDANSSANCVAFSPDSQLLAWGANDSTVRLWRRKSGEMFTLRGHLGGIRDVEFSPDGQFLASASEDGTMKIWRVERDSFPL